MTRNPQIRMAARLLGFTVAERALMLANLYAWTHGARWALGFVGAWLVFSALGLAYLRWRALSGDYDDDEKQGGAS